MSIIKNFYIIIFSLFTLYCCSTQEDAGGTASEGESFVYGFIEDSSETQIAMKKQIAFDYSSYKVYLNRMQYSEDGLYRVWQDSTNARYDGYFEIKVEDSGIYTLIAQGPDQHGAVLGELEYLGESLNLGKLGLFKQINISGSFLELPNCTESLKVSIGGSVEFASVQDSTFQFSSIYAGRTILIVRCDTLIQQWDLNIPGTCNLIDLTGIPWQNPPSGQGGKKGILQSSTMKSNWTIKQLGSLNIGANCSISQANSLLAK